MEKRKVGLGVWFAATRPFAFPAALLSVLVGTAAAAPIKQWRWSVLAVEIVAVMLMHAIGNLLNDYFDYRSGVDVRTEGDEGRPGRFLVKGILLPGDILRLALVLAIPLLPLGAYLIWLGGWKAAAIAAVGLLGGYAYTGPPFTLKYRGLAELCIFVVYGPAIVIGAGYMQLARGEISRDTWTDMLLFSIPMGLLITAIVSANFLRDIEEDSRGGIRTLAHALGRKGYVRLYLALLFVPALLIVGLVLARPASNWLLAAGYSRAGDVLDQIDISPWLLLSLLALPAAIPPARCALRGIRRPDADAMTAKYMTAFGALIFLGLVLDGIP